MEGDLELVLVNGERRTIAVPGHSGLIANVLDRLDTWIATSDGGLVQKSFIVEVRPAGEGASGARGGGEEYRQLGKAVDGMLSDDAHAQGTVQE